jgi:hypothetical protein
MRNLITMKQLSDASGVPSSTIHLLIRSGYLRPAVPAGGRGRGNENLFEESAVEHVRRAARIRWALGDSELARQALAQLADAPYQTQFMLGGAHASVTVCLA